MIPGVDHSNTHVATAAIVTGALILWSVSGRLALGTGENAIVPAGKFSIKGVFEALIEFIAMVTEMVLGEHGKKFIPLFASIFFFILINNLVGLIPGMTPATDNFNTTFAVGVFTFVVYNFVGMKEKKINYISDYAGHLPLQIKWVPIMILLFPIELLSHAFRPVSLGLRLAGNMTGDHSVIGVFLELLPIPFVWFVPLVFYMLGLMVCFIQAFVFTLLSMTYVMMAQAHEDH